MPIDNTKIAFSSEQNYLKRSPDLEGNTLLTLPSVGNSVTHTVTHDLGYIPFFHLGIDTNNDGIVWANDIVSEYSETSLTGIESLIPDPELFYWVTTTTLTIGLINHPGDAGTRSIYWAIYLDYGDV
jgi:hypothetical protein